MSHRCIRTYMLVFLVLLCGLSGVATRAIADEEATFGTVTYPLHGNVRPGQGMLLVWFRLDEDVSKPPGPDNWQQHGEVWARYYIASMKLGPHGDHSHSVSLFAKTTDEGPLIWTGVQTFGHEGHSPNPNLSVGAKWNVGEAHVVGFSWNEEGQYKLWVDGEVKGMAQSNSSGLGQISPEKARLILGTPNPNIGSTITVLGVRMLERPLEKKQKRLPPEKLFSPASKEVPGTLLLIGSTTNHSFRTGNGRRTPRSFPGSPGKPEGPLLRPARSLTPSTARVFASISRRRTGRPAAIVRFLLKET